MKTKFLGFNDDEMRAAFAKVESKRGWKPIRATIAAADRAVVDAAICFFTGGGAEFSPLPGGKLRVIAPGYYNNIGA